MEIQSTSSITAAQYRPQQQAKEAEQSAKAVVDQQNNDATLSAHTAQQQQATTDKTTLTSVTLKNLDTVKAIEQMHTRMNQLVKGARETNEEINKVSEQVAHLHENILAAKNFPPFPADSKERQEILMSYSSIRQEILRMTVPTPPPALFTQVKDIWNSTFSQNGQLLASSVPSVENGSSDKQMQAAFGQLEQTSRNLAELSSGITNALINP